MKKKILELRKVGLTYNEIKTIVGCSKSTISYYCKPNNIGRRVPTKKDILSFQKLYNEYGSSSKVSELVGWSKSTILKYVEPKKPQTTNERKKNVAKNVSNWRRRTKEILVSEKGGKCEYCGYDKCIDALEFHHKNPKEKDFAISGKGITRSIENLKKEIKKCIMVCANCHREIHEKLRNN